MDALQAHLPASAFDHLTLKVLALGFACALWFYRDRRAIGTYSRPDLARHPDSHFFLGDLVLLITRGHQTMELFTEWRAAQAVKGDKRPLSLTLPFMRITDATTADEMEYVWKTNFNNYVKGEFISEIFHDILGAGIFAVDGQRWLSIRKATSKIFSVSNFRGIVSKSIDADLAQLDEYLDRKCISGEEFSLDKLFYAFTISSFGKMAFSVDIDVGVLSGENEKNLGKAPSLAQQFAENFDFAQGGLSRRLAAPWWKIDFWSEEGRKMRTAAKVLDEFAYSIIDERAKQEVDKEQDLLSLYKALRDANGKPLDRQTLRDAVLNLIIAGRDTTAQGLSWIFFHLLLHPELLVPLRAEIDSFADAVTYDSYKLLPQAQAVFNEGLRLHPSVPKNQKEAIADDILPSGTVVRAGESVRFGGWEFARMESVWGPDAKQFKPSRWILPDGEFLKPTAWVSNWFNGSGPRSCLGKELAQFEAVSVLVAIGRKYDVKFAPDYLATTPMIQLKDEYSPEYENSLTLPMKHALRVTVTRRAE